MHLCTSTQTEAQQVTHDLWPSVFSFLINVNLFNSNHWLLSQDHILCMLLVLKYFPCNNGNFSMVLQQKIFFTRQSTDFTSVNVRQHHGLQGPQGPLARLFWARRPAVPLGDGTRACGQCDRRCPPGLALSRLLPADGRLTIQCLN